MKFKHYLGTHIYAYFLLAPLLCAILYFVICIVFLATGFLVDEFPDGTDFLIGWFSGYIVSIYIHWKKSLDKVGRKNV